MSIESQVAKLRRGSIVACSGIIPGQRVYGGRVSSDPCSKAVLVFGGRVRIMP
jgi:uncharacterized protein YbjQ (UPF0145 family)